MALTAPTLTYLMAAMPRSPALASLLTIPILCACGGSAPPAQSAEVEPTEAEGEAAAASGAAEPTDGAAEEASAKQAEDPTGLPTECAKAGEVCTPPGKFVTAHCNDPSPTVALALFAQGTPWTRVYLTRKTQAWNASGGASAAGWLEFDEEVLVLRHRKSNMGGMQVSGAGGGYDAMRWDGSCVTLAGEEVTTRVPPAAKFSKVNWRWLEDPMQEALKEDAKVEEAYVNRRKHCKGATMGEVSRECERWDAKLSERIINYVRSGGRVPTPQRLPGAGE